MLTFLKKAGLDILKGIGIVAGFIPVAQAAFPAQSGTIVKVGNELDLIKSLVMSIEAIGAGVTPTMTGAQKLAAITPQVAQVILQSDFMVGHHIKDQALFTNGAEQIASGMANLLNSFEAQ